MDTYVKDGKVLISEIVYGIKDGVLGKAEIYDLINDERIRSEFIGKSCKHKVDDKKKWTKEYLNKLILASVAECFNEDYLFYLYDVAEYVREKTKKKKAAIAIGGIMAFVLLIGLIIIVARR